MLFTSLARRHGEKLSVERKIQAIVFDMHVTWRDCVELARLNRWPSGLNAGQYRQIDVIVSGSDVDLLWWMLKELIQCFGIGRIGFEHDSTKVCLRSASNVVWCRAR